MVLSVLRSRKFARRVLLALLILIIPAFVLWGVGNVAQRPGPVGQIGGRNISPEEFAESRQGIKTQVLFTYYGNFDTMNQILRNRTMMNFMAWERLVLLDAARKKNIKITNEEVLSFLTQHPLFQKNGVFNKEIYDYILRNNLALGPRQFEELVRQNLQVTAFRQDLFKNIKVSDEEVAQHYKKTNDKVVLTYVFIDKEIFAEDVAVSAEEAEIFYTANKDKFLDPAKVEVEYIEFPYANASEKTAAIDEIEKIYSELKASPEKIPETAKMRGLRHGKTAPFSREDVVAGVPFFKEFHVAAFALDEGELSPPVFSSPEKGSAYILRKVKDIPPRQMEFEEVRVNIVAALGNEKSLRLAKESADLLYEKLPDANTALEKEAQKMHYKIKTTEPVDSTGYIENIGAAGKIVARALETGEGEIIPPVVIQNGVVIVRVDTILPADETILEKQKEFLRRELLARKQMSIMDDWFRENEPQAQLKAVLEEL
ncbi:MAG: SurA N-terminal domain-containing protein [Candidatus Omnitrophota bacterium]